MCKCDFCPLSNHKGKCTANSSIAKINGCRDAIKLMVKVLGKRGEEK